MSSLSLGKKANQLFQSNIVRVMVLSVLMLSFVVVGGVSVVDVMLMVASRATVDGTGSNTL